MTRTWISRKDHRWVMLCDRNGCDTTSEPFAETPDLQIFRDRGWFVAQVYGDRCPKCRAEEGQ